MKNRNYSLVLCEGATDQALIGSYLSAVDGWQFVHGAKEFPFPQENICWYQKEDEKVLGIWQVGGHEFCHPIKTILLGEKKDKIVSSIAIVTDHDDADAEDNRSQAIVNEIVTVLGVEAFDKDRYHNKWFSVDYKYPFGETSLRICYILVPLDGVGALETFMMNSLSEQDDEKKSVILQAKTFVKDLSSDVYLKKRREQVKAELGVSLSVFSPDKALTTMIELIESVNWEKFETTNKQFERLREL